MSNMYKHKMHTQKLYIHRQCIIQPDTICIVKINKKALSFNHTLRSRIRWCYKSLLHLSTTNQKVPL